MTRCDLLNDLRIKVTDKCLANGGELRRHPTTYPDIHLYETRRLNSFDVNRVAVIESACEVTKPPRLGDTLTVMLEPPEAVIVKTPEADFVASAWAIAVTVTVAGFGTVEGAV